MKTDRTMQRVVVELAVNGLLAHPLNRVFEREGGEWAEFVRSVKTHGVLQPLVVREKGDGHEILAGHRRAAAAVECGQKVVPCMVREMEDGEALEFLLLENLQRTDLDPVEEAELVAAMVATGRTAEDVARRISRSVEWVTLRQGVLGLGDEVRSALKVKRGEHGHLSVGAAAALIGVPAEERPRAVQLVLHPDWQDEPLGARDAAATVNKLVMAPLRARMAWEQGAEPLKKAWRTRLQGLLPEAMAKDLAVMLGSWDEPRGGWDVEATEELAAEEVTDEGAGKKWVELAVRHGLAVRVLPGGVGGLPVVDGRLLRQAEEARAENGLPTWLKCKGTKQVDPKVASAVADLDGEGDPDYDEDEAPGPVATPGNEDGVKIEQTFKHSAMIDMGAVKKLAMWAVSSDADPNTAPEFVPGWAKDLAYEGNWNRIDQVCNWVVGLKG